MLALDPADVHLWRISLRATPKDVVDLWSLLSAEERQRAEKMASDEQRARFTACRAAVRQILGMYLEAPPEEILVGHDADGHCRLANNGSRDALCYNLSQSRDLAVLAVACNREIGVDIEAIRPVLQMDRIADRVLGPTEKAAFLACDAPDRLEMFFRLWTQKKAYVKALGSPSRIPLDRVEVDVEPDAPVRMRTGFDVGLPRDRVTICDFVPGAEFCGAFAVQGPQLPKVRCWKWFHQM